MTAISGYAELLLSKMATDDPAFDRISAILEQIDKMGEITRKLMTITRWYRTKDYSKGKRIIDLDKSSSSSDQ